MTVTSIDIREQADSELIFWIESNMSSSAFSLSGYNALLSRIYLHPQSRVRLQMSYELIPMEVS